MCNVKLMHIPNETYFQNFAFEIIFLWFSTPILDVLLLALLRRGEQSLRAAQYHHSLLVLHSLLGTKKPIKNETKSEVLKVFVVWNADS